MGLIDKIKNSAGVGLVAGSLYVSSLLPSVCAQEKPQLQLPDKLTQQTADFYKNPEKEFEFYFQIYHELAEDRVINSNDVETLAFVLTKTLEEIQAKINSNKTTDFASANKYVEFCSAKTNGDLACLNSYLGMKKKWQEICALKARFWNYGTGLAFYGDLGGPHSKQYQAKTAGISLEEMFSSAPYSSITLLPTPRPTRVTKLTEEFTSEPKIDYLIGLLAGLILPAATCSLFSKIRRDKDCPEISIGEFDGGDVIYSIITPVLGLIVFDSVHPLAYPIRLLALPLMMEVIRKSNRGENIYDGAIYLFNYLRGHRTVPETQQPSQVNQAPQQTTPQRIEPPVFVPGQGFVAPAQATKSEESKPTPEPVPEKKKAILNGRELSDAEQEALDDIITRFKNLE